MIDRANAHDAAWAAYCGRATVALAKDHPAVVTAFDAGLAALLAGPATRDAITDAFPHFGAFTDDEIADAVLRVLGTDTPETRSVPEVDTLRTQWGGRIP